MTDRGVVVAEVLRLFGDELDEVANRLAIVYEADVPGYPGVEAAHRPELLLGAAGLRKVIKDQPDTLTEAEVIGLEAIIVLEGRPTLLIQGGDFSGLPPRWQVLADHREAIKASIARVGRIEVTGHPEHEWIGTGFLAGPRTVLTNRHVAREFARTGASGWKFKPGMSARLNVSAEHGATDPVEFPLTGIAGIHELYDLAVLTVARTAAEGSPCRRRCRSRQPRPVPSSTEWFTWWVPELGRATQRLSAHARDLRRRLRRQAPPARPDHVVGRRCARAYPRLFNARREFRLACHGSREHQVVGVHYSGTYLRGEQGDPALAANRRRTAAQGRSKFRLSTMMNSSILTLRCCKG